MSKKKISDQDVKQWLSQLPSLEDKREQGEVYRAVERRINRGVRKKRHRIVPLLSILTVLSLLAVSLPFVQEILQPLPEQGAQQTDTREGEFVPLPPVLEGAGLDMPTHTLSLVADTRKSGMRVQAFPDRNGEFVIPITLASEETRVDPDTFGLSPRTVPEVDYEIDEENGKARAVFPENYQVSGSSWARSVVESVRWELSGYASDSVDVKTSDGKQVAIGNYGMTDKLPVVSEETYYFLIYHYDASTKSLLTPVQADDDADFSDLLTEMGKNAPFPQLESPIPDHVRLSVVKEDKERLYLDVDHHAFKDERERREMVDALLATAFSAGYREVKFSGLEREKGAYDFRHPIPTPEVINLLAPN